MDEINPLLVDLAVILMVAGVTTIIFNALKQPLVLGYIVAGFLTGPFFHHFFTVDSAENIKFWGDIGVIFLLFALGLEFNFKKIKKVGGAGFITVLSETVIMFSVGVLIGRLLGYSNITSIFLGGMLTISSTSIIIKAFDDLGLRSKSFTQQVFGVLVVEDLIAILQLVILSALALSADFSGEEMFYKVVFLGLFLLLWFTGGIFLVPNLFRKVKGWLNDEILLIISLGLCLGMAVIAGKSGFSTALGAFMIGSVLSGINQSEQIIKRTKPIIDFFGAIFFVSVGMLVDPSILVDYWQIVLLISLVVVIIKPISAIIGLLFSGQTVKNSMQSGMCLCQIGEFSFIIAALGKNLSVTEDFLYPVIVSVSIITTFITPYSIKAAVPLYNKLYLKAPLKWKLVIEKLGTGRKTLNRQNDWNLLLKSYFTRLFIYSGWLVLVFTFFTRFLNPILDNYIFSYLGSSFITKWILFIVTILAMSPFLYALLKRKDDGQYFEKIWNDSKFSRGPLLSMVALKYIIAAILISGAVSFYLTHSLALILITCTIITIIVVASRTLSSYYEKLENNFLSNLHSTKEAPKIVLPRALADELHIEKVKIQLNSYLSGKTISEIHKEKKTGALVIQIFRGDRAIDLPTKDERIFFGDNLTILGDDDQINFYRSLSVTLVEAELESPQGEAVQIIKEMELFQVTLSPQSVLSGKNINISEFRILYGLLLVGIEREHGNEFLRPDSNMTFLPGDTVWVVGDKRAALAIN